MHNTPLILYNESLYRGHINKREVCRGKLGGKSVVISILHIPRDQMNISFLDIIIFPETSSSKVYLTQKEVVWVGLCACCLWSE